MSFASSSWLLGESCFESDNEALQTLAFVVIVFGNQATTYAIRERRRLWSSRPSFWLGVSSVADILIASTFAIGGIFCYDAFFRFLPWPARLVAAVVFALVVDAAKVPVFGGLGII